MTNKVAKSVSRGRTAKDAVRQLREMAEQAPKLSSDDPMSDALLRHIQEIAQLLEKSRAVPVAEKILQEAWIDASKRVGEGEVVRLPSRLVLKNWSTDFSREEIEATVAPKRTLARRISKGELLTVDESDRALRLARLGSEANRVFGDVDKARRWLRKPNRALNGHTPLVMARTETGARLVEDLLVRIDHGVYA